VQLKTEIDMPPGEAVRLKTEIDMPPGEAEPYSPSSPKKVEDFTQVDVPEVTENKSMLREDPEDIDNLSN
jgi:hypothetical protein